MKWHEENSCQFKVKGLLIFDLFTAFPAISKETGHKPDISPDINGFFKKSPWDPGTKYASEVIEMHLRSKNDIFMHSSMFDKNDIYDVNIL